MGQFLHDRDVSHERVNPCVKDLQEVMAISLVWIILFILSVERMIYSVINFF